MKKLTNTSDAEKRVKGIGVFKPGESKAVEDNQVGCFKGQPGWNVEDIPPVRKYEAPARKKKRFSFPEKEQTTETKKEA